LPGKCTELPADAEDCHLKSLNCLLMQNIASRNN